MHFLDSLRAATPLQLRPDRPASTHVISYDQLRLEQASLDLQLRKDRQQLVQIDKLSELIRQKERQLAEQEAKQLERQLLFQIEIDRLRRILTEWDAERRKHQEDSRAKENLYRSRLQDLKAQLSSQLTERVDQIRAENKQDLERIKELYDIRVAKLQEQAMKEEHRLRLAEMETDSQLGRLQLSEADRQKLQAAILLKDDRIALLEEEVSQLQAERRRLKEDNQRVVQERARQVEYLRAQQEAKLSEYQAAKALVGELQSAVQQLRADKQQYNQARRQMGNRVVSLQIRCKDLQQQVQQFRSRKTQHNAFVRQASQNTLSHQQSDRQQLSPALKDSRSLRTKRPEHLEEERERAAELEQKLQEIATGKERQELEMKQQLERKDELLRQIQKQADILRRNLQEKERQLSKVRSSANDLQGKLSQKESLILKLQADLEQQPNDAGESDRVWLQRVEKLNEAVLTLSQEWVRKEKEMAGFNKKVDSTYKQQLQKAKEEEEKLRKQNEDVHALLMQKIKQLSEVTRQLNSR